MAVSIRKRSGSGSGSTLPTAKTKSPLPREKVVKMYDVILKGENPTTSTFGETFWSEFFLLKPKVNHLETELTKMNHEQVTTARQNLNMLFEQSLLNLSEEHHIRVVYALQTLCGLLKAAFKKQCTGGIDLVNLLIGFEAAEKRMTELINHINDFLVGDEPASLKDLCIKMLLIIATGLDNVSQNMLLEFIMSNSLLFESLIHLLSITESRIAHGQNAILLLTLLVQYRKYESNTNPYIVKLSILDDELSLHGYGQVITLSLASYNQHYENSLSDQPHSGWLSSFTSMVGNMFVSDEANVRPDHLRACNAALLALYEAVHLNRNFIATLGHYQTEDTLNMNNTTTITTAEERPPSISSTNDGEEQPTAPTTPSGSSQGGSGSTTLIEEIISGTPSNLLVTFLEYCSIVMQDTKSESSMSTVKLSFLILLCVTEDQYANALMHDPNLVFVVKLHRAPMRHRKISPNEVASSNGQSRSLACSVLDLMVEFIRSHLMKRFPHELYLHSLFIVHRLLSYQKKSRVRVPYPWKELWTALISLIKFLTSNESTLVKKMNIFTVAHQVTIIFNLFITYGDTFLPSPSSYDELYYELVRCHTTFDALYSMALRYSTSGGDYKEIAVKVTHSLVNIRAITAHFNPKIEAWLMAQQLSTPTEDQILDVVKSNYDSLTLKLQDGLDYCEPFRESPKHSNFFIGLVRGVLSDSRQQILLNDLELQVVLQDFSMIQ